MEPAPPPPTARPLSNNLQIALFVGLLFLFDIILFFGSGMLLIEGSLFDGPPLIILVVLSIWFGLLAVSLWCVRRSRRFVRVFAIVQFMAASLVVGFFALFWIYDPYVWPREVRTESKALLLAARTSEDLKQAIGPYGAFVAAGDGSWIAIRYRDTHAGHILSLALALDSEGHWYESRRHFCGSLANWKRWGEERLLRKSDPDLVAEPEISKPNRFPTFAEYDALYSATNLVVARQALLHLGFVEIR
jgi:hypothetical protein